MEIKICTKNLPKLEAGLAAVNGWYLIDAKASTLYSKGGTSQLLLTVAQANHAASLAAQRYVVKGSNGT